MLYQRILIIFRFLTSIGLKVIYEEKSFLDKKLNL